MHKILPYPKFSETLKGSPGKLRNCEKKIEDGKTWYRCSFPKIFSILEYFWKTEVIPNDFFSILSDKMIRKNRDTPMFQFFQYQNISGTKGSPLRKFSVLWIKKNRPKIVVPPALIRFFFPFQEFSATQKLSPTKIFETLRPKNLDGRSWYPPVKHNFFSY